MKIEETGPLYRRWRLFVCVVTGSFRPRSGANIKLWRAYGRWYEAVGSVDIHGDWTAMETLRGEVYGER